MKPNSVLIVMYYVNDISRKEELKKIQDGLCERISSMQCLNTIASLRRRGFDVVKYHDTTCQLRALTEDLMSFSDHLNRNMRAKS